MGLELRHITRIETTFSFFNTDGDHGQSAITTDGDNWVYHNDDKSALYVAARQYYYDGTNHYLDNSFGQVTLYDELLVEDYIRLRTNTTNYLKFLSGSITIVIGGVDAITVDVDDVKIETYVTLASGESVNDITAIIVEPGDNSTICTEKAIVDYITSGAGFWVRQTGTVNRVQPKTILDHVTLGESVEPSSREWVSINCIDDWDGIGLTAFADTHVNAIRFSNTSSLRCEVGYNHNDDYFFVNTNSIRQFSISYAGDIQLKTGAMVNDITTVISEPGDDTTLCTEKSIVDYVAGESLWLKNVTDGFIYPKTVTDFVTVGSATINPDDYYAQILLYHADSAGICMVSNSTNGYSDILMSDTPGVLSGFVSYYHGDDTMSIATAGSNALVIDSNHYVSTNTIRFQANIIYEYETDGNGDLFFNYYGYAGGITQFRDTYICDGKNNTIAMFDGSTISVGIGNNDPGSSQVGATDLTIGNFTGSHGMTIRTSPANVGVIYFSDSLSGVDKYRGQLLYNHANDSFVFYVSSTVLAMTIGSTGLVSLLSGTGINEFSIDGTLSGNSDDAVPTEKAVKTYVDGLGHYWSRNAGGWIYPTTTGDDVSIGTSSEAMSYGSNLLIYNSTSPRIGLISNSTGTPGIMFGDGTGSADMGYVRYYNTSDIMRIGANNIDSIIINENGYGSVRASTALYGMFFVEHNFTTSLVVSADGVAIGSTAPTNALELQNLATEQLDIIDAYHLGGSVENPEGYIDIEIGGYTRRLIAFLV